MAQKSGHVQVMKTLLVSEFKNHCVGVLNEVADYSEEVIVTKRGKPLARIVPVNPPQKGNSKANQELHHHFSSAFQAY